MPGTRHCGSWPPRCPRGRVVAITVFHPKRFSLSFGVIFVWRGPMHGLTATAPVLAAAALLSGSAFAHHSMSMYDMSKVEVIEGKIAKFEWTNPHMYLAIETKGPDGKPALVEGEGVGIKQALVD